MTGRPPKSPLFPSPPLSRSQPQRPPLPLLPPRQQVPAVRALDRKSTRLNSSHTIISYAVFCLKKKKADRRADQMPADRQEHGSTPFGKIGHRLDQRRVFLKDTPAPEILPLPHHVPLPI